jgi:tetratricopeptide (TPR) repeat protein
LPEAHTSLAFYYSQSWQWEDSEKEFKRAISLNPNYPTARQWYQSYLRAQGRFDEALAEIKRARELDPLSPIVAVNLATVYLRLGDVDSALKEAQHLVELDPNFPLAQEPLGKVYIKQGKYSEAVAAFERDAAVDRTAFALSRVGHAYALAGRRSDALAVLKELQEKYERRESLGQYVALVYLGFGDLDQAFAWLEKDLQARSGLLDYFITDPLFDSIRSDRRYAELLRRMGLQA